MIKILGLTTQFGGAGIIEFSNIGTSWGGGGMVLINWSILFRFKSDIFPSPCTRLSSGIFYCLLFVSFSIFFIVVQGLGLRPGCIDGAISISAVQVSYCPLIFWIILVLNVESYNIFNCPPKCVDCLPCILNI